jgi:hypothetical protein
MEVSKEEDVQLWLGAFPFILSTGCTHAQWSDSLIDRTLRSRTDNRIWNYSHGHSAETLTMTSAS